MKEIGIWLGILSLPLVYMCVERFFTLVEKGFSESFVTNEIKRWSTKSKDSNGKQTTKRHVKFLLNISGDFGSRQLEFNSKQKRDECRTMLNSARKKLNLKFDSSDINLDLQ